MAGIGARVLDEAAGRGDDLAQEIGIGPGRNGVEIRARVVLRGSMTLAVAYAGAVPLSPRYAPSLLTWWNTPAYPIRGMTPRSAVG